MHDPGWKPPPIVKDLVRAQYLMELAKKAELEKKLESTKRLLEQQLQLLKKSQSNDQ